MSRPDLPSWRDEPALGFPVAAPRRLRSGAVVALAGLCLLGGVVLGSVASNAATDPGTTQTVTASPEVRVDRVVRAPAACMVSIRLFTKVGYDESSWLLQMFKHPGDVLTAYDVSLKAKAERTVLNRAAAAAKTCRKAS